MLPRHIAIIMDGNGRWAAERGLARSEGHRAGAEAVRRIVTECRKRGIEFLTLYAFSSENWQRPAAEIADLFRLLLRFLQEETPKLIKEGIRLNVLGDMEGLPLPQQLALKHSMRRTQANTAMTLNLALNYGSRGEIVRAVRKLLAAGIGPADVSEELISQTLYTGGQPDPDLVIRTSGEQRLSNFLLYQSAYSELFFSPALWPDFGAAELNLALEDYAARSRRFGKTQAQLQPGEAHGS